MRSGDGFHPVERADDSTPRARSAFVFTGESADHCEDSARTHGRCRRIRARTRVRRCGSLRTPRMYTHDNRSGGRFTPSPPRFNVRFDHRRAHVGVLEKVLQDHPMADALRAGALLTSTERHERRRLLGRTGGPSDLHGGSLGHRCMQVKPGRWPEPHDSATLLRSRRRTVARRECSRAWRRRGVARRSAPSGFGTDTVVGYRQDSP